MNKLEGTVARLYWSRKGEYREHDCYRDEAGHVYAAIGSKNSPAYIALYVHGSTSAKGVRLSNLSTKDGSEFVCVGGKLGRYVAVAGTSIIVPPKSVGVSRKSNGSKEVLTNA